MVWVCDKCNHDANFDKHDECVKCGYRPESKKYIKNPSTSIENYRGSIARAEYKPDVERLLAENKEVNVIIVDIAIPFWALTKFALKLFLVLLVIGLVVQFFLGMFGGVLWGTFR